MFCGLLYCSLSYIPGAVCTLYERGAAKIVNHAFPGMPSKCCSLAEILAPQAEWHRQQYYDLWYAETCGEHCSPVDMFAQVMQDNVFEPSGTHQTGRCLGEKWYP